MAFLPQRNDSALWRRKIRHALQTSCGHLQTCAQRFEFARGFDWPVDERMLGACAKKIHNFFTVGQGDIAFWKYLEPLYR